MPPPAPAAVTASEPYRADSRRGWAIVAALSVTETTSWGVLYYGFGVFLAPMEASLGLSRAVLSAAFSLALALQGIAAVAVGRWLDRHSPRVLMTAGSCAATVGVLAWSQVRGAGALFLAWAGIGLVMSTVLYEPAFTVITKWFVARRRQALTVLTLVAGLASFIFLPLENRLITELGWRQALQVLAVVLGGITIPLHALVLRRAPDLVAAPAAPATPVTPVSPAAPAATSPNAAAAVETTEPDDPVSHTPADALRSRSFRFLAAALVAVSFVASALGAHQVAYLTERGYSSSFAAGLTGTLGAMQLPGRLLFAPLLRWLPRRAVTTITFATLTAGLAVLVIGGGTASVWVFVVLYGMGRGMSTLLRATLVGDLFGARHYGAIAGVLAFCTTAATAAGPVLAGVGYDRSGGYGPVLWALVVVACLATVAASRIERPARRSQPTGATVRPRPN